MKLAGVVVLYNPDKDVLNNISTYVEDLGKLYIVDNSKVSNKDMFDMLHNVEYIPNYDNLGIATALNIGARKAIQENYDYLLTMDQDSAFQANGVSLLKSYVQDIDDNDKIGIVSPFHQTVLTPNAPDEEVSNPLIVMTSGNLVNLKAFQEVNGFKEWLFIDCVDFAFSLDLRRKGYEIYQCNKVILHHELGDFEIKKRFGKTYLCDNHNAIRRYYIIRNSYYIKKEYYNDYPGYCNAVVGDAKHGFFIVFMFEKNKISKLYHMIKGYIHYKRGIIGKLN